MREIDLTFDSLNITKDGMKNLPKKHINGNEKSETQKNTLQ